MPKLHFWYEFASTYSYLSAMRIENLARAAGVELRWRPFLLGPFFKSQGWKSSPFREQKEKGRYMVRDMTRICAARKLPFTMPGNFPQNGLNAARIALLAEGEGWAGAFTRAVYQAEYGAGEDIAQEGTLERCLQTTGKDPKAYLARAREQATKDRLREQTEEAMSLGIFGAPTFITHGGELFWGDDRLEHALDWALKE